MLSSEFILTPSATRILSRCGLADRDQSIDRVAGQLVLACLEEESLAGTILDAAGVDQEAVSPFAVSFLTLPVAAKQMEDSPSELATEQLPASVIAFLNIAGSHSRREIDSSGISSEHLLAAVFEFDTPVRSVLLEHGITVESVLQTPDSSSSELAPPIAVPFDLNLQSEEAEVPTIREDAVASQGDGTPAISTTGKQSPPGQELPRATPAVQSGTTRVLDACLNRAREGLRVLEDYARFIRDDEFLVRHLKEVRHCLVESELRFLSPAGSDNSGDIALGARDVEGDVGTEITGRREDSRCTIKDVINANARRVQESLRSLEEFGKLVDTDFAAEMKRLRYSSYTLHQRMLAESPATMHVRSDRLEKLQSARLCVLLTESGCRNDWQDVVRSCLDGGAEMIQLREKLLDDDKLLKRGSWLVEQCRAAGALCVINDRADIAAQCSADGVHIGQDDMAVEDVRTLVGPDVVVGLSTHSLAQMQAVDSGVDYIGVGPVFTSKTKQFESLAGLDLLHDADCCDLPWFAIGGMDESTVPEAIRAGAQRIALSSAVISAERPAEIVARLRRLLSPRQSATR